LKNDYGLYIHIPLCESKCRYCDFYKVTPKKWIGSNLFFKALEIEFKNLPINFNPTTIFIGGGTPSALNADELLNLFKLIKKYIDLENIKEWTVESNPASLDANKMKIMHEFGVNRLSIGIQSFNDNALKLLGRNHNSNLAIQKINESRGIGFKVINIDMIQAIPGMNKEEILDELKNIKKIKPDHISYYNLIYEPNTPLTKDRDLGKLNLISEDQEADIYFMIKEYLENINYNQYEISNFSLKNQYSLHNMLYWKGGDYIGCGPSAHSHWNGIRYNKINDLNLYCKNLLDNKSIIKTEEKLSKINKAKEIFIMWLRLNKGVNIFEYEKKTKISLNNIYRNEVNDLIEKKLLIKDSGFIKIPENKKFLSDYVFSELV